MTEQIDQFFNPDGTLISIPVKSAKKIAVMLHIARDLSSIAQRRQVPPPQPSGVT
jgi:hypothetical protein